MKKKSTPANFRSTVTAAATGQPRRAKLEIYDGIGPEDWGYIGVKTISRALNEAGELEEIEVRINSSGGIMWEGHAIYNVLKQHKAKVFVYVDGCAASAASLIAMAGDVIEIPKNALMMLHDPSNICWGNARDMRKMADVLDMHRDTAVETYFAKSGKPKTQITQWMADETWFRGEDAVAAGLADRTSAELVVTNSVDPCEALAGFEFRNTPKDLAALLAPTLSVSPPVTKEDSIMTEAEKAAAAKAAQDAAATAASDKAAQDKVAQDAAVNAAVAVEHQRCSEITALCKQAGKPEAAAQYVDQKTPVADVQKALFTDLCKERRPADSGEGAGAPAADANKKYKDEFAANKANFLNEGLTEESYVQQRRIDDGLEQLVPAKK